MSLILMEDLVFTMSVNPLQPFGLPSPSIVECTIYKDRKYLKEGYDTNNLSKMVAGNVTKFE